MRHLTYANVMSTIAMFAALATGTSYAAAKLAANSVDSRAIKNGQIALVDLHPTLRKRILNAPQVDTPKPGTTLGTAWVNTPLFSTADLFACSNANCPAVNATVDGYTGKISMANSGITLPASGMLQFRVTGSITNTGNYPMGFQILVEAAPTLAALDAKPATGEIIMCHSDNVAASGIAAGTSSTLSCGIGEFAAANSKFVRAKLVGLGKVAPDPGGAQGKLTGVLKLAVRKSPI